mmetsp:Transcript_48228/g.114266  ORF Transcript_48228/g.114266 Transcript_48228/m.114266 type:complete len:229 (-) Transcript_48228:41-727(-)
MMELDAHQDDDPIDREGRDNVDVERGCEVLARNLGAGGDPAGLLVEVGSVEGGEDVEDGERVDNEVGAEQHGVGERVERLVDEPDRHHNEVIGRDEPHDVEPAVEQPAGRVEDIRARHEDGLRLGRHRVDTLCGDLAEPRPRDALGVQTVLAEEQQELVHHPRLHLLVRHVQQRRDELRDLVARQRVCHVALHHQKGSLVLLFHAGVQELPLEAHAVEDREEQLQPRR